jgi:predicted RND superfamily exporter protein
LAAAGPPSLYTATILSLGFAVLGLSRFPGLRYLGLLCMVTLLTGFVADATITTTFYKLFFNWNSVRPAMRRPPFAPALDTVQSADEEAMS